MNGGAENGDCCNPTASNLTASTRAENPERPSLDPENWPEFRRIAHQALDDALDHIMRVRERPVWQPVSDSVRAHLSEALPTGESKFATVYEDFRKNILPYATGNIHPRFFGWVHGSGIPENMVAEFLAAAMNSNCGGRDHGAIAVEREVIAWMRELFGFPAESSGLLVSGTSMATLIALGVARRAAEAGVRAHGLRSLPHGMAAYASTEAHECAVKAVEILGLGTAALRRIPVHADFTIDIAALRARIAADRATGIVPFCVIGSAGTVNTAAIDDLHALAALCAEEKIWFHVDGAFGAMLMTSEALRPRLRGIERADSLAFDFHKWAHVQYDAGCVLIRSADLHRKTYAMQPDYLRHLDRGLSGGLDWPCDFGPELSRGFRALKVWFTFKQHGTTRIGKCIEKNCDQASHLAQLISQQQELELLTPVSLNIVCFRFRPPATYTESIDALNENIVADVQESGTAVASTTRIHGHLAIRANITNHRTRFDDLPIFIEAILRAGRERLAHGST